MSTSKIYKPIKVTGHAIAEVCQGDSLKLHFMLFDKHGGQIDLYKNKVRFEICSYSDFDMPLFTKYIDDSDIWQGDVDVAVDKEFTSDMECGSYLCRLVVEQNPNDRYQFEDVSETIHIIPKYISSNRTGENTMSTNIKYEDTMFQHSEIIKVTYPARIEIHQGKMQKVVFAFFDGANEQVDLTGLKMKMIVYPFDKSDEPIFTKDIFNHNTDNEYCKTFIDKEDTANMECGIYEYRLVFESNDNNFLFGQVKGDIIIIPPKGN